METEQVIQISKLLGFTFACGVGFYVWTRFNYIKNTVGWKFIESLGETKKGVKGKDLTLRIKSPAGKETYLAIKHSPIIEYEYTEKGKPVKKYVIYDERAVDYLNGIPILNVTPIDIRPIDRETGLLVNIPSEIIDKLAVDSAKTVEGEAMKDKQMKMLLMTIAGMGVLFLICLTYINQTTTDVQAELLRCTVNAAKSATVIAG